MGAGDAGKLLQFWSDMLRYNMNRVYTCRKVLVLLQIYKQCCGYATARTTVESARKQNAVFVHASQTITKYIYVEL